MEKLGKIPLLFLFLGALLGLFLRIQFLYPTPGVVYTNFLHAHSHTMFLGWVFNALYFIFVTSLISKNQKFYTWLFMMLQALVIGMMISFPIQGYGVISIVLSTLHTIGALVFIISFYRDTANDQRLAVIFARIALVFFAMSAAGPFALGFLMANGLGHTQWYYFAVYYYLHFQYNGFFLFGVIALFILVLERNKIQFDASAMRSGTGWLAIATVPAYFLSVLWAQPGITYNIIAGVAALIQLYAAYVFVRVILDLKHIDPISKTYRFYGGVVLICFILKVILQFASAFPSIAALTIQLRPVVIAYLHLVMLGIITLSLLLWYVDVQRIDFRTTRGVFALFLFSFLGMELCLVFQPWWSLLIPSSMPSSSLSILFFSALMVVATGFLCFRATDKNHIRT